MDEVLITEEFVDTEMETLQIAEELESVPEGWDKWTEFKPIDL